MNKRNLNNPALTLKFISLTLLFLFSIPIISYGQKISLKAVNSNLKDVLREIRKQSNFDFLYSNEVFNSSKPVTIDVSNKTIEEALKTIFSKQSLTYEIKDRTIIINNVGPINQIQNNQQIKGIVIDRQNGNSISGASVRWKNTARGTSTNSNGQFYLSINDSRNRILVVSSLGYEATEIEINELDGNITIHLTPKEETLDLVVVQAYGTTTKSSLTNSVSTINAKDIEKRPISNLNSALAGAFPGISTTTGSGQPGAGPSIRIRGFGSINGDMNPLYVLDGAPYDGTLNNINPDDIENISVLKDASASALYGARAANGVVMITTKSGKTGQDQINVKLSAGINSRGLSDYQKLEAKDYYEMMWETTKNSLIYNNGVNQEDAAILASGLWPDRFTSGSNAGYQNYNGVAYGDVSQNLLSNPFNMPGYMLVDTEGKFNPNASLLYADDLDWKKAIRRDGVRQDYSINYIGGAEKSKYYISLNYLDDEGYSMESDFNRITGRVKVDLNPKPWLKSGLNIGGTMTKTTLANMDAGINENPFYVDLLMGPIYPIHLHDAATGDLLLGEDGKPLFDEREMGPTFTGRNIVAETMLNTLFNKRNAINGRTFVEITFLNDFKFSTNLAADINNFEYLFYRNNKIGDGKGVGGRSNRIARTYKYINFNQLLNYSKQFEEHKVDVLLGHESYSYDQVYLQAQRDNQVVEGIFELGNFANPAIANSWLQDYRTEGFLSRLEYSFADKYFFSTSIRRDGSSKFHPSVRWGNFWSIGGGWEISKEKFYTSTWFDYLKLRASYGEVGSDNLNSDYYYWQSFYGIGVNYGTEPGIRQERIAGNRNLKWESNQSVDAAIEFKAFNNRFNGVFEVFHRNSDALLFNVPLAESSGRTTQGQNIGSMYNQGIEVQLDGDIIRKENFRWNSAINWTTFKNRITKLPQDAIIDGTKKREVGRSIYDYWLRSYFGVNPENGLELYNANLEIDDADAFEMNGTKVTPNANSAAYHYAGTAIPDFYGSFRNTLTFKGISLGFMFMYQFGGMVMDNDYQSLMHSGTYGRSLHVDALNRWQKPGDITDVPKRITGISMYDSDRWLIDGSSLSLRSVTLNYNLPTNLLSKISVERASIFANGENLFMVSRRKGLDPTQAFTGVTSYTYAPARIITIGINMTL